MWAAGAVPHYTSEHGSRYRRPVAPILRQFLTFSAVGTAGFVVDSAILMAMIRGLGTGPYLGRVVSFLCAATFTWAMNRRFTFRDQRDSSRFREWTKFLAANAVGGAVNYSTYALLVAHSARVASQPILGVAAGSVAGLGVNFVLNRYLVFSRRGPGFTN